MKPVKYDREISHCTKRDRQRFWSHVTKTETCWLYGANINRYGRFWLNGKSVHAHRAAKIWASGSPPQPQLLARHKCLLKNCCRPSHVEWGTVAQNARDRIRDNTHRPISHMNENHPAALLTKNKARQICVTYNQGGISFAALGRAYGVTSACIAKIIARRTWVNATKDIPTCSLSRTSRGYAKGTQHHASKLTGHQVVEIRKALRQGENQYILASRFGVSQGCVSDIKHGRTWTHLKV